MSKLTIEDIRLHEEYVQIRINTQMIETAQNLIDKVSTPGKEDTKRKLELLRQVNHSEFCRISNALFYKD